MRSPIEVLRDWNDARFVHGLDRTLAKTGLLDRSMVCRARRDSISLAAMSGLPPKVRDRLLARVERYEARHGQ